MYIKRDHIMITSPNCTPYKVRLTIVTPMNQQPVLVSITATSLLYYCTWEMFGGEKSVNL